MRARSWAMRDEKASDRSVDQARKRSKSRGGTPSSSPITATG
jgi:hypothetical protein